MKIAPAQSSLLGSTAHSCPYLGKSPRTRWIHLLLLKLLHAHPGIQFKLVWVTSSNTLSLERGPRLEFLLLALLL